MGRGGRPVHGSNETGSHAQVIVLEGGPVVEPGEVDEANSAGLPVIDVEDGVGFLNVNKEKVNILRCNFI